MSNATQYLIPWFEPAKTWGDIHDYRFCLDGLCAPCPYEDSFFGPQHGSMMSGLFYLALVAALLNVFILLIYALLPRSKTTCNLYSSGMAVANIFFALGFMLGRTTEQKAQTLCYDSITRATGLRVSRCALSGVFLVFGYLSSRFWLLIWVMDMHSKIIHNKNFYGRLRNWTICFVVLVPLALTLVSLPFLDYVTGPFCLPSYGVPLYLIMEAPVAIIDGCTCILQGWSLVCVVKALLEARRVGGRVPESTQSSQLTARSSMFAHIKNQPIVRACMLLARPILYTQLIHLSNILLGVSLVYSWSPINSHGKVSDKWARHLTTWLSCLSQETVENGSCVLPKTPLVLLRTLGLYFALLVTIFFVVLCTRMESLLALKDLLRDFLNSPFQHHKSADHPTDLLEAKASIFTKPLEISGFTDPSMAKSLTDIEVHQTYVQSTGDRDPGAGTTHVAAQAQSFGSKLAQKIIPTAHEISSDSVVASSRPHSFESNASRDKFKTSQPSKLDKNTHTADSVAEITVTEMLPWNQYFNNTGRRSVDSDVRPPEDFDL